MGIRDLLSTAAYAASAGMLAPAPQVKSPWSGTSLTTVVWADILGSELLPVTRAEAMSVPAIARARHKIVTRGGRLPLVHLAGDTPLPDDAQPAWLTNSTGSTPYARMLWTLDDLIFHGYSLWLLEREDGTDTYAGIIDAWRVPQEWWEFDQDSRGVLVNGSPVPAQDALLFVGPHEGVINFASRTIRGARKVEELWVERVHNPVPVGELHQTDTTPMDDDEIDDLLEDWASAVKQRGGAFGYTPHNIELKTHGEAGTELLVEGRNAAAIDGARVVGVPAALVDASNVNSTLTYETLQGRNLEFAEDLAMYLDPIASRLSQDDVAAPGVRAAFDTSTLTGQWSPTGPATKD